MEDRARVAALVRDTAKMQLKLLHTQLALCFTFAALVRTEIRIGDRDGAEKILATAEKAYSTIALHAPRVAVLDPYEIPRKLNALRMELDKVLQML